MSQQMHHLSAIDSAARTASCAQCGDGAPIFFRSHRNQWACRTPRTEERRRRRERLRSAGVVEAGGAQTRDSYLRWRFGITEDDYEALMADQAGRCAICDKPPAPSRRLAVDHDHESSRVRGLLCTRCNTGLGLLGDTSEAVERAAAYLRGTTDS